MKKFLLLTSTLTLIAGTVFADDTKITVGGFSTFEAGYTNSQFSGGLSDRSFRNDNEIHFNVAGRTDAGLGYGAELDLNADINGAGVAENGGGATNSGLNAHRTYGWLQGDNWGHVEFGSNDSAASTLKVDASNIARATGGIDGDFKYFANTNSGLQNYFASGGSFNGGSMMGTVGSSTAAFINSPNLPVEHGPAYSFSKDTWSNDTKITYYTPRFAGFQLGLSYAPSLESRGQNNTRSTDINSGNAVSDIFSGGLNYANKFDQVEVAAAITGEVARSKGDGYAPYSIYGTDYNANNSLHAWNAGGKASYDGVSLAGSYGYWGDSFATNGTKASYWTAGAAYEYNAAGLSVTYLSSDTKPVYYNNKFQDISFGADYKLAPGLTPFVEYTWYEINPAAVDKSVFDIKTTGSVVLVGSQLSF